MATTAALISLTQAIAIPQVHTAMGSAAANHGLARSSTETRR